MEFEMSRLLPRDLASDVARHSLRRAPITPHGCAARMTLLLRVLAYLENQGFPSMLPDDDVDGTQCGVGASA